MEFILFSFGERGMDSMTEQQFAQLTATLVEVRHEINKLSVSVILLKTLFALQVFQIGQDDVPTFLVSFAEIEHQFASSPQEQKTVAAILQALKHWNPGRA